MDLIDRYLGAVKRELPEGQREDVAAELGDVLLSQREEREAELGRALTREETEAMLVGFGHPLVVAGRYRKVQHLIGPEMFPFWWFALKLTFATVGGVYLVLVILRILATEDVARGLSRVLPSVTHGALFTFGVVTLVCFLLERSGLDLSKRWRPRDLPPSGSATRSRFDLSTDIAMGVVFILWWTGAIEFSAILRHDGYPVVGMAQVWRDLHAPILAYAVASLAVSLVEFVRPAWVTPNRLLSVGRHLTAAAILVVLLRSGPWATVSAGAESARLLTSVELAIQIGLSAGLAASLWGAGQGLWRLARGARA
ncbi:hypothetical protein [Phenylobacterium sp.]|uniref:hypothetical protein n=1 Tax=Phenylobacterium sp. TaxID=1871053 RepID=UPI00286B3983|nr:hypothetical protein [Phenylobacterium sp.]